MDNPLKTKQVLAILFFLALSFTGGIYVGNHNRPAIDKVFGVANKDTKVATTVDFEPFWEVWNTINEKYPSADAVTHQERVYGAISGLMGSLNDPYSVFFQPEEAKSFEDEIAGNFIGVGMEVGKKDDVLTVIAPLKDTPAYRANIKSGDKILRINKESTSGLKIEEAIKLIRGEKGTTVSLTILHEGDKDPVEIDIVRDIIDIPTIDTEVRKDGIFVISLYSFSANSTKLFRDAIKQFALSGADKLILDLRGNPGGYLSAAVDMASWFLPGGDTIVVEEYGNDKPSDVLRSRGYNIFNDKLKFVVLIDRGSASASEIVAGALQDHGVAKLVGTESFGKGSVQQTMKITPDTLLKITIAKWLTPSGKSLSEGGLTPDHEVKITDQDLLNKKDLQMEKAVELLLNWTPIVKTTEPTVTEN